MLPSLDQRKLVFLDESGVKTNMTRLRGQAKHGLRLFAHAPHGHWCTTTLTSSIRFSGETAAMELDGATDSIVFRTYVERILVPDLKEGDIVVMDNLGGALRQRGPFIKSKTVELGFCSFRPATRTTTRSKRCGVKSRACCGSWRLVRRKNFPVQLPKPSGR